MAIWGALTTFFRGAGKWIVIGLLVVAAIVIPGFGWYRAKKKLNEERAAREAAERRAESALERARIEANVADDQRRINEGLAAEQHRLKEEAARARREHEEERKRIGELEGGGIADELNELFEGDKP